MIGTVKYIICRDEQKIILNFFNIIKIYDYSRLPDLNQRHFDNGSFILQTTTVKCSTPELNRDKYRSQ